MKNGKRGIQNRRPPIVYKRRARIYNKPLFLLLLQQILRYANYALKIAIFSITKILKPRKLARRVDIRGRAFRAF